MIPSVIIVLCLIYVLFVRRQGDFFTLAIFSSSLYFMPVIFGYTWYIQDKRDIFHQITPEMNVFYALFLIVLLTAACINDLTINNPKKNTISPNRSFSYIYFISISFFVIWLSSNVDDIFSGSKENFGTLYNIKTIACIFSCVLSFVNRKFIWFSIFLAVNIFDVYSGNRESVVFSSLAIFIFSIFKENRIVLISKFKIITLLIFATMMLLIYKLIGAAVIDENWELVVRRLLDFDFYFDSITKSEPFITQTLFYYATNRDWMFDGDIFANLLNIINPLSIFSSTEIVSVSDVINEYMSHVNYGFASNLLAESYLIGGKFGIFLAALLYAGMPLALNMLFRFLDNELLRVIVVISGVVLIFFVHRAGIEYTIIVVKRFVLFGVGLYATNTLLRFMAKR